MRPPAPPRFSITKGWPSAASSAGAIRRATVSLPLPGASGRMKRTGRVGQAGAGWAEAAWDTSPTANKAARRRKDRRLDMIPSVILRMLLLNAGQRKIASLRDNMELHPPNLAGAGHGQQ